MLCFERDDGQDALVERYIRTWRFERDDGQDALVKRYIRTWRFERDKFN